MKHSFLWSSFVLFGILLCIASANGKTEQKYKANESGSRAIAGNYCGNDITSLFVSLCISDDRKRRSMFLDEKEAMSFLQETHHRQRRSSGATDVVEECCTEGCAYEEMLEYC